MKKILVYAHYFYPDVASTGQILTELFEGLQEDFNITVICVVPSYTGKIDKNYRTKNYYFETYQKIKIVRIRVPEFDKKNKISRIKNILVYFFKAIAVTFKLGHEDIIFSISQPPFLGGILGVIGKFVKKAKFIYDIQDFNPEQTEAIGYLKNKPVLAIAKKVDKLSCSLSDLIIIVGRDMRETLIKRFHGKKMINNIVINNWIDETKIFPLAKDDLNVLNFSLKYGLKGKYVIMYSGNIGLYYDLQNIIKVIGKFKNNNDLVFAFVGDGSMKQTLIEYAKTNELNNVRFIPYQKREELNYTLNAADIHLVASAKGIKGISVPSKIYGVMAAAKAVIGILEKGTEARCIIEESNCGYCVEPGNYEELYRLLISITNNRKINEEKGLQGRKYLEKNLKKEVSILKYKQSILEI